MFYIRLKICDWRYTISLKSAEKEDLDKKKWKNQYPVFRKVEYQDTKAKPKSKTWKAKKKRKTGIKRKTDTKKDKKRTKKKSKKKEKNRQTKTPIHKTRTIRRNAQQKLYEMRFPFIFQGQFVWQPRKNLPIFAFLLDFFMLKIGQFLLFFVKKKWQGFKSRTFGIAQRCASLWTKVSSIKSKHRLSKSGKKDAQSIKEKHTKNRRILVSQKFAFKS